MKPVRTIGIVNGGGDAPGLNPVIRAVVRTAISQHNMRVIGIRNGFDGLRLGVAATVLVAKHHFGRMVCLKSGKIESVSLDEALEKMKYVDPGSEIVHAARAVGATFGDSA